MTYYFYIFLCFTAFSFFCLSFSSFVFFDYQTQLLLESVGKWASYYKLLHQVFSSLFIGKPTFAFFMWTRAPSAQSSICTGKYLKAIQKKKENGKCLESTWKVRETCTRNLTQDCFVSGYFVKIKNFMLKIL